ncbi:6-carboxytetrahydropterin synthase QueD [Alicyclobacillus cycloheptanicus]|uniref:6-carboxy-5,6,7,8-tetrahydropterin synthase n=1 Tax=Alicyclobacillus cycloheptanicus TaxID=1457 RepID=A0ABT9XLX6_9BACL|nr:6-carboxytetrahydropterin synthase QueD [Alicyclobacillus cycloheptanicus]MDQ0191318.1 6-pyruvoyltetrahydropterin/6-carboxytetrahydropterin synthase [Alicyclobacillus cycloheptanicus]WDM00819.1 6-carboxytetrahydropterin synthase QueD [Alicyclobacillus cycloheptanicus]
MPHHIPTHIQTLHQDIQPNQLRYHRRRVAVSKEFTFDAAHHLHLYPGKCQSLHGHTYRLVITVSGIPDEIGLTIDFEDLKRIYKDVIESRLDHQYLNEVLPPMNTTAENMIVWMWEQLEAALAADEFRQRGVRLEQLELYETPTSRAILTRAWMEHLEGSDTP